ncbi:MAG TPA: hypothetical protein VMX17_07835 [Candidatus Glassbacteria bacterium]|nr:hypothetical protein [Candidatus Glassbacteria bacterium]
MKYGIIYTIDITRDEYVEYYLPPKRIRRKLQLTEGDESYDLDHMGGPWTKGKHRKLVGVLNQKDFDDFVDSCSLTADDVETMGSLGLFGYGISPAISFNSQHYSGFANAYVTPIPSFELINRADDEDWQDRSWARIKAAIVKKYG